MATLLGTCLQKLYSYSLNLNSLFMTSTFLVCDGDNDGDDEPVRGEDQVKAHAQSHTGTSTVHEPEPNQEGRLNESVRQRGFYRSNLVLDTNHCHHPSYSCRDQPQRVITRAQVRQVQNQSSGNGTIVASRHRHRRQEHENSKPQNQNQTSAPDSRNTHDSSSSSCTCPAARVAQSLKMGAIKFLGCSTASSGNRGKNKLPTTNASTSSADGNGKGWDDKLGCCKCDMSNNNNNNECQSNCSTAGYANAGDPPLKKKVYCFHEAPHYLRFNPHITDGYRGMLRPVECLKSLFWWTNETMNIWTHLFGWIFFLALSVYDFLGLLELPNIQPLDKLMLTGLLLCFQACMLLSSLYHIFCCHSEVSYRRWLSLDLLGVSLSLLAIYVSGIYYAFSCVPFWLNFYLVTVGAIFATAMFMQILPIISKAEMVTEERFRWRLVVFGGWAAYGVVPTMHWAYLHGMAGPAVSLLLPRIFGVYALSAAAFFFYVTRIPEKLWPGLVNYIGSSHQIWHILIVAALYHWHNTGLLYLQFRAAHPCAEEYEYLFGVKYTDAIE